MICASCGQRNRPVARFCDACGSPFEAALTSPTGEHRQLTAMFCDIVGSTPLAHELDPEDLREVVRGFQAMASEPIERFGGCVAQYLGDGLLAYFGYPRAHEDDAARALHAALVIVAALPGLNRRLRSLLSNPVRVRIALNTGLVVVGEVGAGERLETLALGDAVHIAERLLQVAQPDWIVASEETWRLAAAGFVFESLGPQPLRGVAEPVGAYRVLGERAEASPRAALSPLVGRDHEMERLLDVWSDVGGTTGRVVLLEGEAGIGKSRLVRSFCDEVLAGSIERIEWNASRHHSSTAFHPVILALERLLELERDDGPERVAEKLEHELSPGGEAPDLVLRFARLLSRPLPARYEEPIESTELRRRATLDALCSWVVRRAAGRRLVLVVEDLHWTDPSTLELIGRLVEACAAAPLLLLLTHRPSFAPPWRGAHIEKLALEPLTRWQVAALVEALTSGRALPSAVREHLITRTDGVPLFVEELTQAVLESDALQRGGSGALLIPSTLRGSLTARLDNLGPAKKLAQIAAVLGREFPLDLLEVVAQLPASSLELALRELIGSGLVQARDGHGYAFKHALVQEVAYQTQLRAERSAIHARVAEALETHFPERAQAEPETMARHCEQAGLTEAAICYLKRAGEQAIERSAHAEALVHLERAMGLVTRLPEGPERSGLEVGLLIAMGSPIVALKGFGHPDIERTQRRAYELSREVGEGIELYQAFGALYLFYGPRAELDKAESVSRQLIEMGRRRGEGFVERMGEGFAGLMQFYRGHFLEAWRHCQRMLALEDESSLVPSWYIHDLTPEVVARYCGSVTLAMLGRADEAIAMTSDAITWGRQSRNPFNLGCALVFSGLALHSCGETGHVLECAEEAVAVTANQGFPMILGLAIALRGWAIAETKDPAEGTAQVRQGLALGAEARALVEGPRVLGLLAEAQRRAGNLEEAQAAVASGLGIAERLGNTFWSAELERLAAELRLEREPAARDEVAASLRRALERARAQGALLVEQRVRESMARYRIESV